MSKLEDTIKHFKEWQEKIVKLDKEASEKLLGIKKSFEEEAAKIQVELNAEIEKYKAEFKKTFGFCDGERANSLTLIETIKAVNELEKL